jgi:hypothetical protein
MNFLKLSFGIFGILLAAWLTDRYFFKNTHIISQQTLNEIAASSQCKVCTLDPVHRETSSENTVQGYIILSQRTVPTNEIPSLLAQLSKIQDGAAEPAACFEPRLAIVTESVSSKIEILLCFKCGVGLSYRNGFLIDEIYIRNPQKDLYWLQ